MTDASKAKLKTPSAVSKIATSSSLVDVKASSLSLAEKILQAKNGRFFKISLQIRSPYLGPTITLHIINGFLYIAVENLSIFDSCLRAVFPRLWIVLATNL